MTHPLATVLAEKEYALEVWHEVAQAHAKAAPEADRYWGDRNASRVALINIIRAATLALEVIALRNAIHDPR
jgi:hypothetical protein